MTADDGGETYLPRCDRSGNNWKEDGGRVHAKPTLLERPQAAITDGWIPAGRTTRRKRWDAIPRNANAVCAWRYRCSH